MAEGSDRRAVLGVVFVLVGAVLILNNFYIIPWEISRYLFRWYNILIVIGLVLVVTKGNNSSGFILMSIGGFFLALDFFHFSFREFWPVVLVLVGIGLLIRNSAARTDDSGIEKKNNPDFIDEVTIFGGTKKIINSKQFRGGKTTALFGGTEIIMQNAVPVEKGAVIDVFTMFGGTEFVVPSDWDVKVEATAILGGIDDKRATATSIVPTDPNKKLIIRGFVMFGGVDIKSYS